MFVVIVGTRPEIIKMASIIKELERSGEPYQVIHTGQHYDPELSEVFFDDLELPRPDHFCEVGSGSQGSQTARALERIEAILMRTKPDTVLVQGDTNTVLAGALAAAKLGITTGHVEAGLRSYDTRMPEEHNRRLTDHISHLLFAPTENSKGILKGEKVWGKVFVTGNTVIDACQEYAARALERADLSHLPNEFILATAHRAENVDDRDVLSDFIRAFKDAPHPVVYPMHPRARARLKDFGMLEEVENHPNIIVIPPQGYMEFLALMQRCRFILTDSGGIQEEATAPAIRKKVYVLRTSTERPEAVEAGYARVVGVKYQDIVDAMEEHGDVPMDAPTPYGSGDAGRNIVSICIGERDGTTA